MTARRKKTLKIVHPIWSHCITLTDDPFWKEVYTQASYGKMPKHFVYSNNILGFSKGVKKYRSVIVPQQPTEAFTVSMQFFRENGLLSERDTMIIQSYEEETIPDGYINIDLLPRNRKKKKLFIELVLREFAYKYCDEHHLTGRNELFNTLHEAYRNKCLNNVLIKDKVIVGIDGLSHDENGNITYTSRNTPKPTKVKYTPTIEVIDPLFTIRSKSRVDIAKNWFNWITTVNQELGRKEFIQQYIETTTNVSETD